MTDPFDQARAVADAVLYEGYLLYPYTADSPKNRMRWQFGVVQPPSFADETAGEYSDMRTECLLDCPADARVHVRLRFLRVQQRVLEEFGSDGRARKVDSLTVGERTIEACDEAVEHEHDLLARIDDLVDGGCELAVRDDPVETIEDLRDANGELCGRITRRLRPLRGQLSVHAAYVEGPYGGVRLRVTVHNTSQWEAFRPSREQAVRHAFVATHLLLAVDRGAFLSLIDPPEWAKPAAEACRNERCWPVLLGSETEHGQSSDAVLAAPIILYDNPRIAPESPRQLHDATEIDEILTLRTMALTDEEKQRARGTDERAREIIDGADNIPPEVMERLHGTLRYMRSAVSDDLPTQDLPTQDLPTQDGQTQDVPAQSASPENESDSERVPWWDPGADAAVSPESDSVEIDGVAVRNGSKVRLQPNLRGADAQDMFLVGRVATVHAVYFDVDGGQHLAVTLDEDPAAEIQNANGRFRYFAVDEVTPLVASEYGDAAIVAPRSGERPRSDGEVRR